MFDINVQKVDNQFQLNAQFDEQVLSPLQTFTFSTKFFATPKKVDILKSCLRINIA